MLDVRLSVQIVEELGSSFERGNDSLQSVCSKKYSIILDYQMCVCVW